MSAETDTYIKVLDALRQDVAETIDDMDAKALDWAPPAADTNSAAALAAHIAGAESFWIHQVVGGIDIGRDRDAEFATRGSSSADLQALLRKTGETTREVLGGDPDLDKVVVPRPGEPPSSLRYSVVHMIEHMGQHLGHLALTKQLREAR